MPASARRVLALTAPGLAILLLLAGCTATPDPAETRESSALPSATPSGPDVARVAGYDVGDFPPVPLFALPDLSLLDTSASAFTIATGEEFTAVPGVSVQPAHCDGAGVPSGQGTAYLYGDGSGNYVGPDGTVQNFGDGSGISVIDGVTIQNFGDGSGTYTNGTVTIQNFGDGVGNYTDGSLTVQIFGDGSGNFTDGSTTIQNFGDGIGNYTDGDVRIQNFGDGSGTYTDGTVTIQNYGDGTGIVNGVPIEVEPIAPVPELGVFPPIAALAPLSSCGTTITFRDGVLFDFGSSDIRPDATATLATVARVLSDAGVTDAQVSGHTDAIGSDSANQALSESRAAAVVDALSGQVDTRLTAEGFGESRPVAANEIDGVDNPAGRQLNRRVEIFIPTAP
ncbi:OmpA family protein [Microbacterium sp. cx-55]|uniref:OmpA family protein n=1 Tax=Microbacterium sp. cx-55 TaxID=2875948 RepID=UPI001CBD32D0|nr:OmpA family protein [Microbacterium sp. cx-55]MBZ4486687.1 OmpA family protein [Microbacterium sp. cx-55]UGB36353.1 OmpA family protein [Microbacterium sp. cx-55]